MPNETLNIKKVVFKGIDKDGTYKNYHVYDEKWNAKDVTMEHDMYRKISKGEDRLLPTKTRDGYFMRFLPNCQYA